MEANNKIEEKAKQVTDSFQDLERQQTISSKPCPVNLHNAIENWCVEFFQMDKAIIAGGFIRAYYAGEKPFDMDVYFEDEDSFQKAESLLINNQWQKKFASENALSYVKKGKMVQLIKAVYGNVLSLLENFDFTVCCCALVKTQAIPGEDVFPSSHEDVTMTVYMDSDFFEHLAARLLVFNKSSLPLSSLKRTFKYVKRGYHICDENIIKIVLAIIESQTISGKDSNVISGEDSINSFYRDGTAGVKIRSID